MKTWLVTGAAGFLGSHLTERLIHEGARVAAVDNLAWGNIEHLKPVAGSPHFIFYKADIRDTAAMNEIIKREQPDYVVHLAALHFIPTAVKNPTLTVSVNVHGTQCVLNACRGSQVERFWFASTGDVYAPSETPHNEDDTVAPFNIYGLTKSMGEQLVALEASQFPERGFICGRLFNLYGARETNPHILPEIIKQLHESADAVLRLGNLWPKRDLVPVTDAARAIVESVLASAQGLTTANFATGSSHSMEDVIAAIGELRQKPLTVETDPAKIRSVERPVLQADVSRLRSLTGWAPSADLRQGLTELLTEEGLI